MQFACCIAGTLCQATTDKHQPRYQNLMIHNQTGQYMHGSNIKIRIIERDELMSLVHFKDNVYVVRGWLLGVWRTGGLTLQAVSTALGMSFLNSLERSTPTTTSNTVSLICSSIGWSAPRTYCCTLF